MSAHSHLSAPLDPLETGESPVPATPVGLRSISSGAPPDMFFHLDLKRSLQMHRKLFACILMAGMAAAAAYFFKSWPVYISESIVYIQPAPPRLLDNAVNKNWPYDENTYESYLQQQINNVKRGDVLRSALRKLPGHSWQGDGESEQAAVERLGRALTVERMGSSYQISISAKASDAAFAAQISNAVAAAFVETAKSDLRAGDPERIKLLGEERDRIQKALAEDHGELEQVNRALGMAAVSSAAPDPYQAQIDAVRADLVKARTAHDEASARLTTLATTDSTSSAALDAEADEIVTADPGLVSMKASLNQRRALLISQMANLTANHPQYKQDAAELAQINASLDSMMKDLRAKAAAHIQQRLRNDLERTGAFEARLNTQLGQLTNAAGNASSRLQRANDLTLDIQRLQNRFTTVDEQYRNLTLENKAPGAASISSPAVPALHPFFAHVGRNLVILLVGTLLLALGAAVTVHNLDPRVYIASDVERVLGFSPMAQLPDFREVSSAAGEEYMLRLAAAIEHAYQQNGLKSCIVTGVAPGAGASTVASRVSTMLEGMGRSTMVVDASGTPPAAATDKDGDAESSNLVTMRTDRPSALLEQMAADLNPDTIVLTDTAPLLASGETEYLARFVDSAIVVIQSGITTRAQLREIAHTLQRLDVTAVGFVLNRVSIDKANPSFRQSVRAVEARLEVQNRAQARHASRTRPSALHPRDSAEEPSVVTDPEPVKPPEPARATSDRNSQERVASANRSSSQARAEQPVAAPAQATASEKPAAAPSRVEAVHAEPVATDPGPAPRVARGRGEPRPAPAPPRPAATAPPVPSPDDRASAAGPATPVTPRRAVTPPVPVSENLRPPAAAVRPVPTQPANRPAETWMTPVTNEPFPGDLGSERDDAGYAVASRLSGLRNLLVTLGRRSLHDDGDSASDSQPDIEPRFERATVRAVNADSPRPAADAPDNGVAVRLNAEPEILPPKPMVEVEKEREAARPAATAPRRDNWDSEEVQTLPSWRGQYRKKRYPQL